jgi:hypothetical protein
LLFAFLHLKRFFFQLFNTYKVVLHHTQQPLFLCQFPSSEIVAGNDRQSEYVIIAVSRTFTWIKAFPPSKLWHFVCCGERGQPFRIFRSKTLSPLTASESMNVLVFLAALGAGLNLKGLS